MIRTPQSFSKHFFYLNLLNFHWNICPRHRKEKKVPIPKADEIVLEIVLKELYIC